MIENVFDFDKELHLMDEEELRTLLRTLYLWTDMELSTLSHQTGEENSVHFAVKLQQIFKEMAEDRKNSHMGRSLPDMQNAQEVHIAIGESPLGSIKVAMGRVPGREGRRFFSLNDYYAIGPLGDLTDKTVVQRRHLWLLERLYMSEHGHYAVQGVDALLQINTVLSSIDEKTKIIIWYANNAHERTGLLYAMHLLRDKQSPVYLIDTNELYQQLFNNPDVHDVFRTGEINSEKLLSMWQYSKNVDPVGMDERNRMELEWLNLIEQPGLLRLMKDGAIHSVSEDSIDDFIMQKVREVSLTRAPGEFIKCARIVGEVLGYLDQAVGDAFIEYRIRQLVLQGQLEMDGMPHAMRFYGVRLAGIQPITLGLT